MGLGRRLLEMSLADAWRGVRRRLRRARDGSVRGAAPRVYEAVQPDFLRSEQYRSLMSAHLPFPGVYDRHEAQNETRSFLFRHREAAPRLGVFRWRGLQEHLEEVLELVTDTRRVVVDLGGAACPVGLHTLVVDTLETDGLGRPVPYRDIRRVPGPVDCVFSSHALEHIKDLDGTLDAVHRVLRPGGWLIAHVPSFTCVRWRVGQHAHSLYDDHVWTFGLVGGDKPEGLQAYRDIDAAIGHRFEIETAEYCGDDSIFVRARKRDGQASGH